MRKHGGISWNEKRRRYRAYLHIGNKQMWHRWFRGDQLELAKKELDEARSRLANKIEEARMHRLCGFKQRKATRHPDLLDQLIMGLGDGSYEVFKVVPAGRRGVEAKVVFGPFRDYGAARLAALAHVYGKRFRLDAFEKYLKRHREIQQLQKANRKLAEEEILPLLEIKDTQGSTRLGERVLLGYRWQRVRRFRVNEHLQDSGVVISKQEVEGVHLRIIPDREETE